MNEITKGDKMSRRTEYQIATDELNEVEYLEKVKRVAKNCMELALDRGESKNSDNYLNAQYEIEVADKKIKDIKSKSKYII
jgi:hypothetical protein|tara:strand:+ start:286 stop:528 length:243 start_codon:yes stop_codon:yes gene_type:complete